MPTTNAKTKDEEKQQSLPKGRVHTEEEIEPRIVRITGRHVAIFCGSVALAIGIGGWIWHYSKYRFRDRYVVRLSENMTDLVYALSFLVERWPPKGGPGVPSSSSDLDLTTNA